MIGPWAGPMKDYNWLRNIYYLFIGLEFATEIFFLCSLVWLWAEAVATKVEASSMFWSIANENFGLLAALTTKSVVVEDIEFKFTASILFLLFGY